MLEPHKNSLFTEKCVSQKGNSRQFITPVHEEMNARRLGLHIISSIIKGQMLILLSPSLASQCQAP